MTENTEQDTIPENTTMVSEPQYAVTRLISGDEILGPTSFVVMDGETMIQIWNPLKVARRIFVDGTEGKFLERYSGFSSNPIVTISHSHIINISPLTEIAIRYYHTVLTHIQTFTDKNDMEGINEMISSLTKMRIEHSMKNVAATNKETSTVDPVELDRIKKHYVEGNDTKH